MDKINNKRIRWWRIGFIGTILGVDLAFTLSLLPVMEIGSTPMWLDILVIGVISFFAGRAYTPFLDLLRYKPLNSDELSEACNGEKNVFLFYFRAGGEFRLFAKVKVIGKFDFEKREVEVEIWGILKKHRNNTEKEGNVITARIGQLYK